MNRYLLAGLAALFLAPTACRALDPEPPPVLGTYQVPYRLTQTRHILVRARVNGKGPFNLILDTGAPALFLSTDVAKQSGVVQGDGPLTVTEKVEIEGGATAERVPTRVEEPAQLRAMNAIGLPGARIDGVIGYSLLALFRMEIDLRRPVMKWERLAYTPPALTPVAPPMAPVGTPPPKPPAGLAQMEGLANLASRLMPKIVEPTSVLRGYLGMGLKEDAAGVVVEWVAVGGPAQAAGLKAGDRITACGVGKAAAVPVKNTADLSRHLLRLVPGGDVTLLVRRGKATPTVRLVAAGELF